MNFNDQLMSMVTLFQLMVVNNWFVTMNMYCETIGNQWPCLFFVVWYTLSIVMITNLVVAFILEVFGTSSTRVDKEHQRRHSTIKLMNRLKNSQLYDDYTETDQVIDELDKEEFTGFIQTPQ